MEHRVALEPERFDPRHFTVLVVDDEPRLVDVVRLNLEVEGYRVVEASNGHEALVRLKEDLPDIVILDVMMPELDGFETLRRIRAVSSVPVIMLTVRQEESDRIRGLEIGADDYLTKSPFSPRELQSRIRAVLRRHQIVAGSVLSVGDLRLDRNTREVTDSGVAVTLTPREFDLLECFMLHPRQVLTRDAILNRVWGYDQAVDTNVVDVYVRYLRAKLGDERHERIEAVRGVGYTLRP